MHLVRVGRRILNVDYLIEAEEWGGDAPPDSGFGPGWLRVAMFPGRVRDLPPDLAGPFLRQLADLVAAPPPEAGGPRVEVSDQVRLRDVPPEPQSPPGAA
jgi:hypothetical protein